MRAPWRCDAAVAIDVRRGVPAAGGCEAERSIVEGGAIAAPAGLLDGSVEPSPDPAHTNNTQQANESDDSVRR